MISGNRSSGISLQGAENVVQGNFIGTDLTGTRALGNAINGVLLENGSELRLSRRHRKDLQSRLGVRA